MLTELFLVILWNVVPQLRYMLAQPRDHLVASFQLLIVHFTTYLNVWEQLGLGFAIDSAIRLRTGLTHRLYPGLMNV